MLYYITYFISHPTDIITYGLKLYELVKYADQVIVMHYLYIKS